MFTLISYVLYSFLWIGLINLILYLKKLEDQRHQESLFDFDLSEYCLDDGSAHTLYTYLTSNNILDRNIIISMKNNYKSLVLLNELTNHYDPDQITIIYIAESHSDPDIEFFEMLHDKYNFDFHICILTDTINYTCKDYRDYIVHELKYIYDQYIRILNTDVVIQCSDINSTCNNLLHDIFSNQLECFNNKKTYNNYTIYKPLFNLDIDPEAYNKDVKNSLVNLIDTVKHHYPQWKTNTITQLSLLTRNFDNNTVSYLDDSINFYKNGFVVDLTELTVNDGRYSADEIRYILYKCFDRYNILSDNIMENILELVNNPNTVYSNGNWRYVMLTNELVCMNIKYCQIFIDKCVYDDTEEFDWKETETLNTLEGFLNEKFFEYYNLGEDTVYYENNVFNEMLLDNFTFKNEYSHYVYYEQSD